MNTFHTPNDRLKNFSIEYTLHCFYIMQKFIKKIQFYLHNITLHKYLFINYIIRCITVELCKFYICMQFCNTVTKMNIPLK